MKEIKNEMKGDIDSMRKEKAEWSMIKTGWREVKAKWKGDKNE